jgi:gliding motility-associated-like protein
MDSMEVFQSDNPEVDLGPDTVVCDPEGLVLDAGDDGIYYTWSTGESGSQIVVYNDGDQEIWVEVENEYGCVAGDTVLISPCSPGYMLHVPTGISPYHKDGKNDTWRIERLNFYSKATVEIFDQWGTLIWRSAPGYPEPWDGTNMSGKIVPVDSYHFVIRFNDGSDEHIVGYITVIK